jgi:hypothetical protein
MKINFLEIAQIELDEPSIDIIFALGLRLENAEFAAKRAIADRLEPELEDGQLEALSSVLQIHAVFMVSEPEGIELLAAAERYSHKIEDDERFKSRAERVVSDIEHMQGFATDRLIELLQGVLKEMMQGEHPARTGTVGRNTIQRALVELAKMAISGAVAATVGQIFIHSAAGQIAIADGASFMDKAVVFFLQNADNLRALAAVSQEGFGFLNPLIDWLKARVGV